MKKMPGPILREYWTANGSTCLADFSDCSSKVTYSCNIQVTCIFLIQTQAFRRVCIPRYSIVFHCVPLKSITCFISCIENAVTKLQQEYDHNA